MSEPVVRESRSLLDRVRDSLSMLGREIAKFGVVGLSAFAALAR